MEVRYRTDIDSPSGYSRAARMHVRALMECGVKVIVEQHKKDQTTIEPNDYWRENLPKIMAPVMPTGNCIRIWHETPDFFNPRAEDYNIGMVPWETSRIPSRDLDNNPRFNWCKQMNRMNEMWTNAESSKKAFIKSGVVVPIYVFPHPINLDLYKPAEDKQPLLDEYSRPISDTKFVVLSVFQWIRRKNPGGLIGCYYWTFNEYKDVCLTVKTYGMGFNREDIAGLRTEMENLKKGMRLTAPPGVFVIWDHIPEGELPELYQSCDVYAGLPYGEGFGLPYQEAMACGKPVIFPRSSSMLDFCDNEVGYGVDVEEEPVLGMRSPWYDAHQTWWRPSYMSAKRALLQAYADWTSGKLEEKGKVARKRIEELHSFEVVGNAMKARLQEIQESSSIKL